MDDGRRVHAIQDSIENVIEGALRTLGGNLTIWDEHGMLRIEIEKEVFRVQLTYLGRR